MVVVVVKEEANMVVAEEELMKEEEVVEIEADLVMNMVDVVVAKEIMMEFVINSETLVIANLEIAADSDTLMEVLEEVNLDIEVEVMVVEAEVEVVVEISKENLLAHKLLQVKLFLLKQTIYD